MAVKAPATLHDRIFEALAAAADTVLREAPAAAAAAEAAAVVFAWLLDEEQRPPAAGPHSDGPALALHGHQDRRFLPDGATLT